MITGQLAGLKLLMGVTTDMELAAALGLDRSTIAQWKRRGRLPERYADLSRIRDGLEEEMAASKAASRQALRGLVYRHPNYHLWLAAVLGQLTAETIEASPGETLEERGRRLEHLVCDQFQRCLDFSQDALGKVMPETRDDYIELVHALATS